MDNWRAWLEDSTLADVAGLDNAEDLIDDPGDWGKTARTGNLGWTPPWPRYWTTPLFRPASKLYRTRATG